MNDLPQPPVGGDAFVHYLEAREAALFERVKAHIAEARSGYSGASGASNPPEDRRTAQDPGTDKQVSEQPGLTKHIEGQLAKSPPPELPKHEEQHRDPADTDNEADTA